MSNETFYCQHCLRHKPLRSKKSDGLRNDDQQICNSCYDKVSNSKKIANGEIRRKKINTLTKTLAITPDEVDPDVIYWTIKDVIKECEKNNLTVTSNQVRYAIKNDHLVGKLLLKAILHSNKGHIKSTKYIIHPDDVTPYINYLLQKKDANVS